MDQGQTLFSLEENGPEQLAGAVDRLPPGGTLKLDRSAVALKRVDGGRGYRLLFPPKVTESIKVELEKLGSPSTASEVFIKAHQDVLAQLDRRGVEY